MQLPRISVVTPNYNYGHLIEHTIRSVLDQDYPNLEYIVVDDGSTDNSVEVIRKYEGRLRLVVQPNRGQSAAINHGFRLATGEIQAWLNSDDLYLPGALHRAAKAFQNPRVDFVFGDHVAIDLEGWEVYRERLGLADARALLVYLDRTLFQEATFWRRHVYEACGPIDDDLYFSMDYAWFLRVTHRFRGLYIPEYLGAVRVHAGQKTAQMHPRLAGVTRGFDEGQRYREKFLAEHRFANWRLALGALWYAARFRWRTGGWRGLFRPPTRLGLRLLRGGLLSCDGS